MKFTEKGEIEFGYSINGNKIEFYVSDTGIGIPPDLHPKIFSRFFQAENSSTRRYEGTGLGLSISKAYVELLGGEIWFTSQPGKGSVFCFTLPC
jgi:signal transduction histidine kinase